MSSPGLEKWQDRNRKWDSGLSQGLSILELALNLSVVGSLRENLCCHVMLLLARDDCLPVTQCRMGPSPEGHPEEAGQAGFGRSENSLDSGLLGTLAKKHPLYIYTGK